MDEIKADLFEYSFELLDSTISSVQSGGKDTTIIFSSLNIHKYFGKIEFGIEESFAKEAQLMIRDAIIHGEQPEYPSSIVDASVVQNGSIYGNYIDYPFTATGDLQFVITFSTHDKVIIKSSKAFMVIKDLDNMKSDIQ